MYIVCYPRDATLYNIARYYVQLSPDACLCLSSRRSIETDRQIELVLARWLPSTYSKNNCSSNWNFVPNSGLREIRHNTTIVATYCQLTRQRWTLSVINFIILATDVGRTKLIVLATVDVRRSTNDFASLSR